MSTSGMGMMLKSLGVNPKMFEQVGVAVQEIVATLRRIEQKQDSNEKLLLSLFHELQKMQGIKSESALVKHAG